MSIPHPGIEQVSNVTAQALVCNSRQQFSLVPVILPEVGAHAVAIRTRYSGVSVGTEFALVRGKLNWGPYPICTGYMAVGRVEAVGTAVDGFRPGDRVYYRDNGAMRLDDGTAVSAVAGTHCSHAVVDTRRTHGLAILPEGADEVAAGMFVLPAVALNGVDQSGARMGQETLVHGCGPVGLGVVAMLVQRGCRVTAADPDATRLAMARRLGADTLLNPGDADFKARATAQAPQGFDVVFECTGLPACLGPAMVLCRKSGTFVWQGNYGAAPFPFEFLPAHERQLTMRFPCDDGLAPCRAAVVKQMTLGILPWRDLVTHIVAAEKAAAFFDQVNRGAVKDLVGAVIDWT